MSFPEANRSDVLGILSMLLERLAVSAGPAEGPLNGGGGHLVAVGTHHRGDLAVPPGGPIRCVLRGDCLDRVHSRRRPWPDSAGITLWNAIGRAALERALRPGRHTRPGGTGECRGRLGRPVD